MDYLDRPPRQSRRLILCARVLLAVCLVSGALLLLRPAEPIPVPPTTVPGTTVAPTPRLRASGLGAVTVGMSWAEVVAAGVVELQTVGCQVGEYLGATVYGMGGSVTAIVVQDEGVRTLRGVGVGSSRAELAEFYSTPAEGEAVTVVEGTHVLVFGIRDDVVAYIRAGRPEGPGC